MVPFPSICAACGAPLAADAQFCGDCGARVTDPAPTPTPPSGPFTSILPAPELEPEPSAGPAPAFPSPAEPADIPPPPGAAPPPPPSDEPPDLPAPPTPGPGPGLPSLPSIQDAPTLTGPPPSGDEYLLPPGAPRPPRNLPMPAVIAGAVAALVAATVLIVSFADSGRVEPGAVVDASTTIVDDGFSDLTTPLHTRDEFVAAAVFSDPGLDAGATPEETACLVGGIVDAIGGPEALQDQSITPEEFAGLDSFRGIDFPPTAIDTFTTVVAGCGVDPFEVLVLRPGAGVADAELLDCLRNGVDHATANREIARTLFDSAAFTITPALQSLMNDAISVCVAG